MHVTNHHGRHQARRTRALNFPGVCSLKRRIFRDMKPNICGILLKTCGLCVLFAVAPLALAQTPKPPAAPPGADPAPPPTPEQASYLFGLMFGTQMHSAGIGNEVSIDAVSRGVKDGLQGKQPTPAEQQQLQAFAHASMQAASAHNQAAAKDFLARNGQEKGVVTTASGLEYKIISAGDKKAPDIKATDKVTVEYRGKLIDGSEFDSSYSRGVPATFPVNGVIKGWQEALVMMKPGAKWQLFIPPELAYGDVPRPKIPGGSLLIFEVSLVSAESAAAQAPPAKPPGTPAGKSPPSAPSGAPR
jgi:FKBP-type peptidyl-prolyl cis-trans isomerase FklB